MSPPGLFVWLLRTLCLSAALFFAQQYFERYKSGFVLALPFAMLALLLPLDSCRGFGTLLTKPTQRLYERTLGVKLGSPEVPVYRL